MVPYNDNPFYSSLLQSRTSSRRMPTDSLNWSPLFSHQAEQSQRPIGEYRLNALLIDHLRCSDLQEGDLSCLTLRENSSNLFDQNATPNLSFLS